MAINLVATRCFGAIARAQARPVLITAQARGELTHDPITRLAVDDLLAEQIAAGFVEVVELDVEAAELWMELVSAAPPDDLGDGEAATLAYAHFADAVAVLDDRKVRRVGAQRFVGRLPWTTVSLLREPGVEKALTFEGVTQAVADALAFARMRVLDVDDAWVRARIGLKRAAASPSLRTRRG